MDVWVAPKSLGLGLGLGLGLELGLGLGVRVRVRVTASDKLGGTIAFASALPFLPTRPFEPTVFLLVKDMAATCVSPSCACCACFCSSLAASELASAAW